MTTDADVRVAAASPSCANGLERRFEAASDILRGEPPRRASALMRISIARLATETGVTPRALRHYEAKGLLRPARGRAGRRGYPPDQVARAHAIVLLRALEIPIPEILTLIGAGRSGAALRTDLKAVLALKAEALERRREALQTAMTRLDDGEILLG